MSKQLCVRIPDDIAEALDHAAAMLNIKSSEVIRLALRDFLHAFPGNRTKPAERVQNLLGSIESGIPDLAERHRDYLVEVLKRGR